MTQTESRTVRAADRSRVDERVWIIGTALVAFVGIGLRCWRLGAQSLWFDEGFTAWMISHPASQIIRLVKGDTSPPLYYLLLRTWTLAFGDSEAGLRSLSLVFSAATIGLVYLISRRLFQCGVARSVAVALISLSAIQIQYAQEARGYALMAMLTAAALLCLCHYLQSGRGSWFAGIPASLAAAAYTHNAMLIYIACFPIAWLFLPGVHCLGRRLRDASLLIIIVSALYAPWLPSLTAQMKMIHSGFWVTPPTLGIIYEAVATLAGAQDYWSFTRLFDWLHLPMHLGVAMIRVAIASLIGLLIAGATAQNSNVRRATTGLSILALGPVVIGIIYSCWRPSIFLSKAFIGSAVILPLLLAAPLELIEPAMIFGHPQRWRRWLVQFAAGASVIACVPTVCGLFYEMRKEPWRDAAAYVTGLPPADRAIVFDAYDGQPPFDYYYWRFLPDSSSRAPETGVSLGFYDRDPPRTMLRVLSDRDLQPLREFLATRRPREIVLVSSHSGWADPNAWTLKLLQKNMTVINVGNFREISVWRFESR